MTKTDEILAAARAAKGPKVAQSTAEILEAARRADAKWQSEGVGPLLKEYTTKLEDFAEKAIALREAACSEAQLSSEESKAFHDSSDFLQSVLLHRISSLAGPIRKLSRAVSQLIENGKLASTIERVELEVRLADLEGALHAAQDLISRPFPRPRKR